MADIQSISTGLKLGEDGIWYSIDTQSVSYPLSGNKACFAIEERSFWFKHRNNCILSVVQSYPPAQGGIIFDIGGGNGFVSSALAHAGFDVALVEPGQIGASNAKRRGLETVICATTDSAGFKPHSLPAVGLFDVLEHIRDDLAFLQSLRNLMKKQGRLYVAVPAYSFLWSENDVSGGHFRRYTLKNVREIIEQVGFEVEFSSYIFRLLPIPIALFRAFPYRMGFSRLKDKEQKVAGDHAVQRGTMSSILEFFLNSELENLKNNKPMRFGGSCLVVATSPSSGGYGRHPF